MIPICNEPPRRRLDVLVLEDSFEIRTRLLLLSSEVSGLELPQAAANLREARELLQDFHPDVALLDLQLPDGSGLEILRELRALSRGMFIAVLTSFGSPQMRQSCLDAGADAFISKSTGLAELSTLLASTVAERGSLMTPMTFSDDRSRQHSGAARDHGSQSVELLAPVTTVDRLSELVSTLVSETGRSEVMTERVRRGARQCEVLVGRLSAEIVDLASKRQQEAAELERRLHSLSHTDALTGLHNIHTFNDRMEQALAHAPYSGHPVGVLLIDLDRFKIINDTLGHRSGDVLLTLVAERLRTTVYDSDTVARLGGDEFLVLLPRLGSVEDVTHVVKKILDRFKQPFTVGDHDLFVKISMGVSIYPLDGTTGEELVKNADIAMYRAKQLGGGGYQFYADGMNARTMERIALETGLHRALDRGELVVHYQPLVDIVSGEIDGVEALVRWQHPTRGLVPPCDFIPLAEETGLIFPIGAWVLRTACQQASEWLQRLQRSIRMAVNLSARQFRDPNLLKEIDEILAETGLPAALLELEITETIAMEDVQSTHRTLHDLKARGIRITMDDFGTGYSSLAYLKKFPIDSLKIDRSFIEDLATSSGDLAITVASITVAHGLNLRVIAEGVETSNQLDLLRHHNCDAMQGFLISRPVLPNEIELLLTPHG